MRLAAVPENLLERLAMATGMVPDSLVCLLWSVALPRILLPALRAGVVEALGSGTRTAEEVAAQCHLDPRGTEVLLAALNGFGFLRHRSGRYRLTADTARWILSSSPRSLRPAYEFAAVLEEMLGAVEGAVRTGERGDFHAQPHDDAFWRGYLEGLGTVSRLTGAEIARRARLGKPRRILDVAGGHGGYSVALCERYPDATAVVLDLPPACTVGRGWVAQCGLTQRISFAEGNLLTSDWGVGYDVVLLFNILHNLEEADARAAIAKAHAALVPGGHLLVLDGDHRGKRGDRNAAEGFGELFFFALSASRTWPVPVLTGWLADAGFAPPRRIRLFSFPNMALLEARA
jgi:SAM-dependent methyltransferase